MKKLLVDYSESELAAELMPLNIEKYRIGQIYKWLNCGTDFDGMTNLPKELRARLSEEYTALGARIVKASVSGDGTVKFLFRLCDGNLIEGVLMKYKYGNTLCVSTQVGCRMGCAFCASGIDGLLRNLTAGEMLSEVICANAYLRMSDADARIGNVVLMGSGEPLDNYENVTGFIRHLSAGQGIGQRSVSLSTCGLVSGIRRLADDGYSVTLCISLHAPTDDKRVQIMPTARAYKIADIISAAAYYFEKSGRRVIFEYAMMRDFNISSDDAENLRKLTHSFPSHINLIPLNETGSKLKGVNKKEADTFLKKLTSLGASATVRRSLGDDIEGACGQLKRKYAKDYSGGSNDG